MKTQTQSIQIPTAYRATDYGVRTVNQDGKSYLVAPVVMMVEGVHIGSRGPVLHTLQALEESVSQWEGYPVTVDHPTDPQGTYISAQQEEAQRVIVGEVRNARMDGTKLKAEIWLNEQRLMAVSPEALEYIRNNKPLDVSTGIFTQEEAEAGEWNGEQYESIATHHQPDHLALLPGDRGACSWQDGCGVRVNKQITNPNGETMPNDKTELLDLFKQAKQHGFAVHRLQVNEVGFRELASKVQNKLNRMDSEARLYYLHDVYEDHLIYFVHDRDQETERYYKQNYTANEESGDVSFEGDPVEVRKEVEFVEMTNNAMKRTKFNNNQNLNTNNQNPNTMENEKKPCGDCMEKVVGLINNKRTRFTKADREWLLQLNESQLDSLQPTDPEPVQVNREQALEALQSELADPEKLVSLLPEELKEQIQTGLSLHKQEREKLTKSIQANTEKGTWPDAELEAMNMDTLRRLEKSSRKADYSGQGDSEIQANQETEEQEFLAPAGIEVQ